MFTVEQRNALREHLLRLAEDDERVVSGAVVGSLARGGGDRFSDLDVTFEIADHVPVAEVLDDWTQALAGDFGAVPLTDLERGPTIYRVFLLPDALQLDISMTPAAHFGAGGHAAAQPQRDDLLGWGVIYALHARACIERGRVWQAEHYVGAVRDRALALACLREGARAVQARGYDDLSADTLARFHGTHVDALEPGALRKALAASVSALMRESRKAGLPHAETIAERLAELSRCNEGPPDEKGAGIGQYPTPAPDT